MDELSQKKLNEILKKEVLALTDNEIAFLKARSSYLTAVQEEVYKKALKREPEVVNEPNLGRSRSYRAMQKEGSALGIKVVGISREDLERSLDTAKGPN